TILGGRTCGWFTAWFNLVGLITVMAAINSGAFDFAVSAFGDGSGAAPPEWLRRLVIVGMTLAQGLLNHYGIRWTTRLVDASGWLILITAAILIAGLFHGASRLEWSRLWTFSNFSGLPEADPVFPRQGNVAWLFALGFLFPAYTITGFDASAHTAEETLRAATNVPKGIVRSVVVSSLLGWILVVAILLAMPDLRTGAMKGPNVTPWVIRSALSPGWAAALLGAILLSQFLCGLAALTSASRMTYAFARDGGLPFSGPLSRVHAKTKSPSVAVWFTALSGVAFTTFVSYTTIAAVCTLFLYLSYVLPVAAGFKAHGRTWSRMGPWHVGAWYRPLALASSLGCAALILLGLQPPNDGAVWIVGSVMAFLLAVWFGWERRRFRGPPAALRALT
ncbi:MAG: amino acid permease, partial [Verrucomicrobia bacterium]|nr:amino acid permease [Verrucomicrobiota bacterium]